MYIRTTRDSLNIDVYLSPYCTEILISCTYYVHISMYTCLHTVRRYLYHVHTMYAYRCILASLLYGDTYIMYILSTHIDVYLPPYCTEILISCTYYVRISMHTCLHTVRRYLYHVHTMYAYRCILASILYGDTYIMYILMYTYRCILASLLYRDTYIMYILCTHIDVYLPPYCTEILISCTYYVHISMYTCFHTVQRYLYHVHNVHISMYTCFHTVRRYLSHVHIMYTYRCILASILYRDTYIMYILCTHIDVYLPPNCTEILISCTYYLHISMYTCLHTVRRYLYHVHTMYAYRCILASILYGDTYIMYILCTYIDAYLPPYCTEILISCTYYVRISMHTCLHTVRRYLYHVHIMYTYRCILASLLYGDTYIMYILCTHIDVFLPPYCTEILISCTYYVHISMYTCLHTVRRYLYHVHTMYTYRCILASILYGDTYIMYILCTHFDVYLPPYCTEILISCTYYVHISMYTCLHTVRRYLYHVHTMYTYRCILAFLLYGDTLSCTYYVHISMYTCILTVRRYLYHVHTMYVYRCILASILYGDTYIMYILCTHIDVYLPPYCTEILISCTYYVHISMYTCLLTVRRYLYHVHTMYAYRCILASILYGDTYIMYILCTHIDVYLPPYCTEILISCTYYVHISMYTCLHTVRRYLYHVHIMYTYRCILASIYCTEILISCTYYVHISMYTCLHTVRRYLYHVHTMYTYRCILASLLYGNTYIMYILCKHIDVYLPPYCTEILISCTYYVHISMYTCLLTVQRY